jgi:hypothetical protein
MSINSLSNKNAPNVVASASLQSNGATLVRKRKKWTMEMNIFIIREYFRITKLQDVVSTYRLDLFKAFQSKYPQFPVTIQNLADQRRAIMKKNYIPSAILEKIKNDVKLELSINYSDNNEVSNNLVENSVEPQSLQSLPNHNDSFCYQSNSTPNNTIQNDINNLDLSYNDIHVINQLIFTTIKILKNKLKIQKGILLYSCHIVRKFLNIDTEHKTQKSQNVEARRR